MEAVGDGEGDMSGTATGRKWNADMEGGGKKGRTAGSAEEEALLANFAEVGTM